MDYLQAARDGIRYEIQRKLDVANLLLGDGEPDGFDWFEDRQVMYAEEKRLYERMLTVIDE